MVQCTSSWCPSFLPAFLFCRVVLSTPMRTESWLPWKSSNPGLDGSMHQQLVPVFFACVSFLPGGFVYADADGVLLAVEKRESET